MYSNQARTQRTILAALLVLSPAATLVAAPQATEPGPSGDLGRIHLREGPRPAVTPRVVHAEPLGDEPAAPRLAGDAPAVQVSVRPPDELPPAASAVLERGADGELRLVPAGSDPYYLGFAAGIHRPAPGERLDPELLPALFAPPADGRPGHFTYAFAMLAHRITEERLLALQALGARVLDLHPSNCVKLALPMEAAGALADHAEVRWLGVPRPWQKLHPSLEALLADAPPEVPLELYVSVFESDLGPAARRIPFGEAQELDPFGVRPGQPESIPVRTLSEGWQQRALEGLGLVVEEYLERGPAFRVRALPGAITELVRRDFVQFIEPVQTSSFGHDDSMPMVHADLGRSMFNGSQSGQIVAGQIDSGLDTGHFDLNLWGVGWELGGSGGPWSDPCEHGTHVGGSLLGRGLAQARYRGTAPGLGSSGNRRFFNIKASNACGGWNLSLQTAMDLLTTPYTDGGGATTPWPQLVNHSWGATTLAPYFGTEVNPRILDDVVYSVGQMQVVIAHNAGPNAGTISAEGSAKNVLTIGNAGKTWTVGSTTPGGVVASSGRGPTADERWKPNVCAVGELVNSADAGTTMGYRIDTGTSMAAPHVSGVAAQLMDRYAFLRDVPERVQSVLMATALTRNGQLIVTPANLHLRRYGTGRIEAIRAALGTSQMTWSNWGTFLPANNYTYADFQVGANATRLTVVLHYVEPAASAGASQALRSNFDLYIDQPPVSPAFNTGYYAAQRSSIDNTEIRIIDNPIAGTWRWKVWPENAPTGVYYSVTVAATYASITPDVSVSVTPAKTHIKPFEQTDVVVRVSSPTFIASGVVVEPNYSTGGGFAHSVTKPLADGPSSSLGAGSSVQALLGNILHGQSRQATWRTSWTQEGLRTFSATARGENIANKFSSATLVVDGTPPSAVTNLGSSTHVPNVWSNAATFTSTWTAATDNFSGVDGYSISTSSGAPATPNQVKDIGVVTSHTQVLASSSLPRYFNIRAVDRSGNWGPPASAGPYLVDTVEPTPPTNLASTTHQEDVISCTTSIAMTWTASSDAHSGVAGYRYLWDHSPLSSAHGGTNLGAGTSASFPLTPSGQPWYFHLAARDHAGNLSATRHAGPFWIDPTPPAVYCTAKVNSLGCTPSISFSGTPSLSGSTFSVQGTNLLGNQPGMLFWSLQAANAPFQGGFLCAALPVIRTSPMTSDGAPGTCGGSLTYDWTSSYMQSQGLAVGQTVHCQFWTRDPNSPSGTGLTDAVRFTICQ